MLTHTFSFLEAGRLLALPVVQAYLSIVNTLFLCDKAGCDFIVDFLRTHISFTNISCENACLRYPWCKHSCPLLTHYFFFPSLSISLSLSLHCFSLALRVPRKLIFFIQLEGICRKINSSLFRWGNHKYMSLCVCVVFLFVSRNKISVKCLLIPTLSP